MKETSFIQQNKEKWERFEKLYESNANDPEELSNLYMDMTDDLSYAQTFYKRRTVRVYLNQLAQKVFTGVHKQRGESLKKLLTVWKVSLPLEIYRARKNLLFALVAFMVYVVIGAITTHFDPDFPRVVMGDGYVDMTIENIKNGVPLDVYQDESQLGMFIQITTNNMKVSFLTFFIGFFFTIGTHVMMFYNGVMLGAFQYFFKLKGLLITSFLGIWIHGAFEISSIVIAGAAGITAGNGWLFPRSYTRLQSLQLSTKRGLKIMMSLVPFVIAAGFLESFVTHNYQTLPEWSKWTLIMLSFGLILFVYVFYPIHVARKYPELVDAEEAAPFRTTSKIQRYKIRNVGQTISDSFQFYRMYFKKFSKIIFTIVVPITILLIIAQDTMKYDELETEYWYDWAGQLGIIIGYDINSIGDIIVAFLWTLNISLVFTAVFWSFTSMDEAFSWEGFFAFAKKRFLAVWLGSMGLFIILFGLPWYLLFWAFFLIPLFYLQGATMGLDDAAFGGRLKKSFRFSVKQYGNTLLTLGLVLVFIVLIAQPIAFVFSIHNGYNDEPLVSDALDMLVGLVKRVSREFTDDYIVIGNIVRQVVYVAFLLGVLPLLAIIAGFSYYTELDKSEAKSLKENFKKFGKRNRYQEKSVDFE
ncbi:MAG: hypothetical protein RI922_1162 [Bacteroidota bacterium]|jgi:uncharacterized membrane protein SpoIIM required for sporulation